MKSQKLTNAQEANLFTGKIPSGNNKPGIDKEIWLFEGDYNNKYYKEGIFTNTLDNINP